MFSISGDGCYCVVVFFSCLSESEIPLNSQTMLIQTRPDVVVGPGLVKLFSEVLSRWNNNVTLQVLLSKLYSYFKGGNCNRV